MKRWDFYETFTTRAEALAFKRANKGRKLSAVEEIYTVVGTDTDGGPVYGVMYQVGGMYIF